MVQYAFNKESMKNAVCEVVLQFVSRFMPQPGAVWEVSSNI